MRRDVKRRIEALEAKVCDLDVHIDFLGLFNPDDPRWEDVQLEGRLPEYAEQLGFQRSKTTRELRAFFNYPATYPGGADLRFL